MKIAICCDHAGFKMKEEIVRELEKKGHTLIDCGSFDEQAVDYPDLVFDAATRLSLGECERAIAVCGTGIGVSIVANKIKGVWAAVVVNEFMAASSRSHNNANMLCLGARLIDCETALKLVDIFLNTEFSGGRHSERINKLSKIENKNLN